MKNIKKLLTLLLALIIVASCVTSAMAWSFDTVHGESGYVTTANGGRLNVRKSADRTSMIMWYAKNGTYVTCWKHDTSVKMYYLYGEGYTSKDSTLQNRYGWAVTEYVSLLSQMGR